MPKSKSSLPLFFGLQVDAQLLRSLISERHSHGDWVEAGDVPALLREPDGVAPPAHAYIQRSARFAVLDHLPQKRIRIGVENRLLGCENPIPSLDFS